MKNALNFVLLLFVALFSSCSQFSENEVYWENQPSLQKYPQKIIVVESEIQKETPQTRAYFLRDSIWPNGAGTSYFYENDEIAVTNSLRKYAYPGAILKGGSLDNNRPTPISAPVDPITISFSFPNTYSSGTITRPSLSATRQALMNAMLDENMHGTQSVSFDYSFSEATSYEEAQLTFGSRVDVGPIFHLDVSYTNHKKKRNTLVLATVTHRFYTIDMDLPTDGNLLQNNEELITFAPYSPIYVSSVTYGRIGIISIETDSAYNKVTKALNMSFNAVKINGSMNIDTQTQKLLEDAKIAVHIIGGSQPETTIEGLNAFKDFIENKGVFSIENLGAPIFLSLNYLSDNSPYFTKFLINIPK